MTLTEHIKRQPIMDAPYKRHLESAPIFNEVQEARRAVAEADQRLKAALAKAKLFESTL